METGWLDGEAQPLAGQVGMTTKQWDRTALDHRNAFEFGLREAGLPDPDVLEALTVRDDVAHLTTRLGEQIEHFWATTNEEYETTPPEVEELYSAQVSALDRLRNWFSGRSFRVDDTTTTDVRIPLFVLSAASVPGCTASFSREQTAEGQLSWDVTIFGTGLTATGSLEVSTSATFTAASGEAKVVFLPGSLTVEKVTALKHGRVVGRGYRVDGSRFKSDSQPGLRLLAPSMVLPAGELVSKYPLADDTTGALAKYKYSDKASASKELQLGIKAFGVDVKLKAEAKRSTSVEVTYELKGGFDYELRRFAEGDGLVWGSGTARSSAPDASAGRLAVRRTS
jgi:hypothetical protein